MLKPLAISPRLSSSLLHCAWRSAHHCHQIGTLCQSKFSNIPVEDSKKAKAIAIRESHSADVYFAPAEFQTNLNRTSDNAAGAWCFWADIDVGEEKALSGKGYRSIEKAESAISVFCTEAALPMPTHTVSTGSGLHIYWMLEDFVDRDQWQHLARKLKDIAKSLKFLADPSRTADIASVMRMPDTLNHKYSPPRPVVLVSVLTNTIPLSDFTAALSSAHGRLDKPAQQLRVRAPGCLSSRGPCSSGTLNLLKVVLTHLDPDCHYDDWFLIGCAVFNETGGSEAGLALWDDWSSQSSKYPGAAKTANKWLSINPEHPRPARMGRLQWMLAARGFDWQHILCMAEFEAEVSV